MISSDVYIDGRSQSEINALAAKKATTDQKFELNFNKAKSKFGASSSKNEGYDFSKRVKR